ncbi:hypothetical protein SFUMM280S_09650 [Streptomyces fumanus]
MAGEVGGAQGVELVERGVERGPVDDGGDEDSGGGVGVDAVGADGPEPREASVTVARPRRLSGTARAAARRSGDVSTTAVPPRVGSYRAPHPARVRRGGRSGQ